MLSPTTTPIDPDESHPASQANPPHSQDPNDETKFKERVYFHINDQMTLCSTDDTVNGPLATCVGTGQPFFQSQPNYLKMCGTWVEVCFWVRGNRVYHRSPFTDPLKPITDKLSFLRIKSKRQRTSPENIIPPEAYIVGLSMIDMEPAAMRMPKEDSTMDADDTLNGFPVHGVLSGRSLGNAVIPLQDMTVTGNLQAIKAALRGMWEGRDRPPPGARAKTNEELNQREVDLLMPATQWAYTWGRDLPTVEQLESETAAFVFNVGRLSGKKKPMVRTRAMAKPQLLSHIASRTSATVEFQTCRVNLLARGDDDSRTGFQLRVAPIMLLEFDQGLHNQIMAFLKCYPADMVSHSTALQACCVWADIHADPERLLEKAFESWWWDTPPVPVPSLAEVIIYFPSYLAFAEGYGLIEYPHLFRYVHRASISDRFANKGMTVSSTCLDEEEIKRFVAEARPRVSWVDSKDRISILPADMVGSVHQTVAGAPIRGAAEMASAGLGPIQEYGPTFSDDWYNYLAAARLVMPEHIARCHFHKTVFDKVKYPTWDHLRRRAFFGDATTLTHLWNYEPQSCFLPSSNPSEQDWLLAVTGGQIPSVIDDMTEEERFNFLLQSMGKDKELINEEFRSTFDTSWLDEAAAADEEDEESEIDFGGFWG